MPDPAVVTNVQEVATNGGIAGAISAALTALGGFLAATKLFARQADVDAVKAEAQRMVETRRLECERDASNLRAEIAEKYMTKAAIQPLMDNLEYIRDRVDKLADRQGHP